MASQAREHLDATVGLVDEMDAAQRRVIGALLEMWPDASWIAAGARTAKAWLVAFTGQGYQEAARLERVTRLCSYDPNLATAILSGAFPLGWAERLSRAVTEERSRFLTPDFVGALLALPGSGCTDADFGDVVTFWVGSVDQEIAPTRVQPHSLVMTQRLFGGGEIHATLAPTAFENVATAIDAFCQDPDPAESGYKRTLSERRADGLDDMACAAMTGDGGGVGDEDHDETEWNETWTDDTDDPEEEPFDRDAPGDLLDDQLDVANDGLDDLDILRRRIRQVVDHQRRRARRQTRPRSGARVNAHLDLRTLAGLRDVADLEGLVMRGEGWNLARSAAEQMLCDSSLVLTLFDGKTRVLDANDAAERFSTRQRRAIAARDRHCAHPGCRQSPRRCDTHHLEERANGGPTTVSNGVLLCRFHHRLQHEHGWTLHQDDSGRWIATDRHGNEWSERPAARSAAA